MPKTGEIDFDKAIEKSKVTNWSASFTSSSKLYQASSDMRKQNGTSCNGRCTERFREGKYKEKLIIDGVEVIKEGRYTFQVQIDINDIDDPNEMKTFVARPVPPFGGGITKLEKKALRMAPKNLEKVKFYVENETLICTEYFSEEDVNEGETSVISKVMINWENQEVKDISIFDKNGNLL